jgi:phospholipid transport system substrate-binding protein
MKPRSLLLPALILLSSIVGGTPRSSAATEDPASVVSDFGNRALAAMRNEDTVPAKEERFRQLFRQYFDEEACAHSALGPNWLNATALQRQEFGARYEDYVVIGYSAALRLLGNARFEVLGSEPNKEGVIVSSRISLIGMAPIGVDWQLHPTDRGYKVIDVIVDGISRAVTQHADLVSVIQRNGGHLPPLLVALREKNAGNGIVR